MQVVKPPGGGGFNTSEQRMRVRVLVPRTLFDVSFSIDEHGAEVLM